MPLIAGNTVYVSFIFEVINRTKNATYNRFFALMKRIGYFYSLGICNVNNVLHCHFKVYRELWVHSNGDFQRLVLHLQNLLYTFIFIYILPCVSGSLLSSAYSNFYRYPNFLHIQNILQLEAFCDISF